MFLSIGYSKHMYTLRKETDYKIIANLDKLTVTYQKITKKVTLKK